MLVREKSTHKNFCHGTWFIFFFILLTYPPPFAKLRVSFFTPPPTPIPAMLTEQTRNRFHVFLFDGSLTPRTIGQHCIKGGGGKVQTDPKFRKGVGAS